MDAYNGDRHKVSRQKVQQGCLDGDAISGDHLRLIQVGGFYDLLASYLG